MIARNSLSTPSNIFYAMFYKTVDAQRWFSFAGNRHFLFSVIYFMRCYVKIVDEQHWFPFAGNALLCRNAFCRKHTSYAQQYFICNVTLKLLMNSIGFLLPETHFFPETHSSRAVVFFMQCHVKIVDKQHWFPFGGNALLRPVI